MSSPEIASCPLLRCPKCGALMTCHAEKPSDPYDHREADDVRAGLGVVVVEIHLCTNCGNTEARRRT